MAGLAVCPLVSLLSNRNRNHEIPLLSGRLIGNDYSYLVICRGETTQVNCIIVHLLFEYL